MQSFFLCLGYIAYLLFGAVIFKYIEYENTLVEHPKEQWKSIIDITTSNNKTGIDDQLTVLLGWLNKQCPNVSVEDIHGLTASEDTPESIDKHIYISNIKHQCYDGLIEVSEEAEYYLSFIDCLYFSMTIITTIGYGHICPVTPNGKLICMLYACFGIPFTGILLAWTSDFFGERLFAAFKSLLSEEKQHSKKIIALATTLYIAIGLVVFIFLPSVVFFYLEEEWTYLTSVYYAFITLTTIGFGDFVTGGNIEGVWLYVYQICVIIWILAGLGYWIMIANFITRALQSEKLHSTLSKRAEDVKRMMGMNTDPRFLTQHSKATVNFMLQLSNMLLGPEGTGMAMSPNGVQSSTPASPPIKGIAALFANQTGGNSPTLNLFSPGMFGMNSSPERVPKSPESTRTEEVVLYDTVSVPESPTDHRVNGFEVPSSVIIETNPNGTSPKCTSRNGTSHPVS